MGPTGVGKSTFIKYAAGGKNAVVVGHHLESCTSEVQPIKVKRREDENPVILVDTPGFDDTKLPDTEILRRIAVWLQQTYQDKVRLAGIIYMHRISDNRMAGAPLKNLTMFSQLCGTAAAEGVVLSTTMWGSIKDGTGESREEELKAKFWKGMLDCGAKVSRFELTQESAWDTIDEVRKSANKAALLLQEEMVELERKLSETQAGKTLYNDLLKRLDEQRKILRDLLIEAQRDHSANPQLAMDLQLQHDATKKQIDDIFSQVRELKIPLTRRIAQLFNFRRARAAPVKTKQ
ncbi:hypothetical protein BDN71DRAFT_1455368 [Pleurotus eryngii]|uniref:G domain-containing protein n=1 Tax=Pleurotus eryngii TaxID=5323 RepID=A0A9P5ZLW3_PLEER|nr:hypothetical protein BDN71DRAFT_1455368 [Pleurotus eryngii]